MMETYRMAAAQRVSAAQRHNLLIGEAHAVAEDRTQMRGALVLKIKKTPLK